MRVFLFEFVFGGGCFHPLIATAPTGSLLDEGHAMWQAVYGDLAEIEQVEVVTTRDSRLPAVDIPANMLDGFDVDHLVAMAQECEYSLIIAPEFDNHLLHLAEALERNNCRLLSPDSHFIRLASDKSATAELLQAASVPTPIGALVPAGKSFPQDFSYPAVLKRNDGAGSMGCVAQAWTPEPVEQPMRIEKLLKGTPCSQSFLCRGQDEPISCPPMRQLISQDGSLQYKGGKRLTNANLAERATALGKRTIAALPPTTGYVGVDIILGNMEDDKLDYVIEVNPRITTSYIGLRQLTTDNLAQSMLHIAQGKQTELAFSSDPVGFLPDGSITE